MVEEKILKGAPFLVQNSRLKEKNMTVIPPAPEEISVLPPQKNGRARALWLLTMLLIFAGAIWMALWFFYFRYHEYTSDAYVNGDIVRINSVVPGSVVAFFADNTDLVVEGQLLVELDRTNYQLIYERELANLAATAVQSKQLVEGERQPMIEKQKALVREAFYNLKHCNVYAPVTGYVAKRAVNVGEQISPMTALMAIIPKDPDTMWVDANFKETQLTHMRIGQPAKVWFDFYGDRPFEGKVVGIASGTGSIFSLIPPQNATGNWIKIVQRLPVRIGLNGDQLKDYPLRVGLSSQVKVDISNRDLPMLAPTPSSKPIAVTRIFDIDFSEVDRQMEALIGGDDVRKGE